MQMLRSRLNNQATEKVPEPGIEHNELGVMPVKDILTLILNRD